MAFGDDFEWHTGPPNLVRHSADIRDFVVVQAVFEMVDAGHASARQCIVIQIQVGYLELTQMLRGVVRHGDAGHCLGMSHLTPAAP